MTWVIRFCAPANALRSTSAFLASTPCSRSCATVRDALASTRSATTILPPSWPNRFAVARPIPCPAPVTMHTLSLSLRAPAALASSTSAMLLPLARQIIDQFGHIIDIGGRHEQIGEAASLRDPLISSRMQVCIRLQQYEGDQHIGLPPIGTKQPLVAFRADDDDHIGACGRTVVCDLLPPDGLCVGQ